MNGPQKIQNIYIENKKLMKQRLFPGYIPLGDAHLIQQDRRVDTWVRYMMFLRWRRHCVLHGYDLQEKDFTRHWIKYRYVLYGLTGHYLFTMMRIKEKMNNDHLQAQLSYDLARLLHDGSQKRKRVMLENPDE